MSWAADFETVNNPDDCRVLAWFVSEVGRSENLHYGTDMPSFIEFCKAHPDTYYFHNAAFDCEFIMNWLLRNGFEHSDTLYTGSFTTLISDSGKFYQMEVCFERKRKRKSVVCTFKDSLKKLPMSVDQVAKSFKLPISKLSIDYDEVRPVGHELTEQEKAYITNDVRIMALALEEQFDQGLDNLTIGSDALGWFKEGIGKEKFRYLFPVLDLDTDAMIRKAYTGAEWNGPAQGLLNPVQEVTAAEKRVQNGFSTRDREAMEMNGSDFYRNAAQLKREEKMLREVKESGTETGQQAAGPAEK